MKIVTDYKPAAPKSKYDADAAELIAAAAENPDVIGAITVDVLGAENDEDAANIVARETRSFQAATLKAGFSARARDTRDNGDGSFDVLFSIAPHKPRKPREVSAEETPAAPETSAKSK